MADSTKRELRVVVSETRQVIHRVDVSDRSDRMVERVMRGMLINMRKDCHVEDSADDEARGDEEG